MYVRQPISAGLTPILSALLMAFALWSQGGTASAQSPRPSLNVAATITTTADGEITNGPGLPRLPETGPDAPGTLKSTALSFSYYKVIGSAFQPRMSTSTYGYTTNGCIYQTGGPDFRFQAPVILPEGSIIKYIRLYYQDTATTDMTMWLTRYEPGQANLDLASVLSTGNTGYGTTVSPELTVTVDMATYAYVLTWGTSVATNANQICGARIAYYAPTVAALCTLDIDGNGAQDALTDGLIILRALFGLTGTSVTNNAIGSGTPTRTTWAQIQPYLNGNCGGSFAP